MNGLSQPQWGPELVLWCADIGLVVVIAGMVLCVGRILRGPHVADRALAADTLSVHLVGLVTLFSLRARSALLFDGVMILALLGFTGTVAAAMYIARPHLLRGRTPTENKIPPAENNS